MNSYELVCLLRQDLSSTDVDKALEELFDIIKHFGGKVELNEYLGFRNLAYTIANNKKAHYVCLGIIINKECQDELERKIKLNQNIIRHMFLRVEKIQSSSAEMFQNFSNGTSDIKVAENNMASPPHEKRITAQ